MPRFEYRVFVDTDTEEHATTVMNERIDIDEWYGFDYQIQWTSSPKESSPKEG
jgi:hypothetical protein